MRSATSSCRGGTSSGGSAARLSAAALLSAVVVASASASSPGAGSAAAEPAAAAGAGAGDAKRYEPTWESLMTRPLPDWYDEAKIGVSHTVQPLAHNLLAVTDPQPPPPHGGRQR